MLGLFRHCWLKSTNHIALKNPPLHLIQNLHIASSLRLDPIYLSCNLYLMLQILFITFILHSNELPWSPSDMQMCKKVVQSPNQQESVICMDYCIS